MLIGFALPTVFLTFTDLVVQVALGARIRDHPYRLRVLPVRNRAGPQNLEIP